MSELGPLVGEPLAVDLINSRVNTPQGPLDFLDDVDGLRRWLDCVRARMSTVAPENVGNPTEADLDAVRRVRDHASRAVEHARHGEPLPAPARDGLNEAVRAAPLTRFLTDSAGDPHAESRRIGPDGTALAAHLADATIELLTDLDVRKLRVCEAEWCVLLFLPAHPRRRWCSPTICGNRTRVARFHERRRKQT